MNDYGGSSDVGTTVRLCDYLHCKSVTAGFVTEPWHWKYSSAVDYMTKVKGLLDLVFLE